MPYISESGIAQHSNQHPYIHDGHLLRLSFSEYVPNWQKIGSVSLSVNDGYTRTFGQGKFGLVSGYTTQGISPTMYNPKFFAGTVYNLTNNWLLDPGKQVEESGGAINNRHYLRSNTFTPIGTVSSTHVPAYSSDILWRKQYYQLQIPANFNSVSSTNTLNDDPYPVLKTLMTTYSADFFKDGVNKVHLHCSSNYSDVWGESFGDMFYAPGGFNLSDRAKMVITAAHTCWPRASGTDNPNDSWPIFKVYCSAGGKTAEILTDQYHDKDLDWFNPSYTFTGTGFQSPIEFTNCKPDFNLGLRAFNTTSPAAYGGAGFSNKFYTTWGADFYIDTV